MKKISEGVIYESASNAVIKILAIVTYVLIIRHLSLHDYGLFVILTSL